MEKNILKPFLFIAVLCLFISTTVQAQSVNKISISVKDIGYDDPNFTALREALKKNPKVKLVKPSYSSGVAILSFMYAGDASQLWEEIPKTSKRFFNLGEMGDDAISLDYLNPKKNGGNSTVVANAAQTKTANKKDCFDCDYFPMCKYDETKSYGGKLFRGIRNDDNNLVYYYCENGVVIKRFEYTSTVTKQSVIKSIWEDDIVIEHDDYVNGTATLTIMKSNVPVGTFWESKTSENSKPYHFTLAGKGIKLTKDGKTYSDVIKIAAWRPSYKTNYYFYGKNVGYLGENLEDNQLVSAKEAWGGVWKLIEENGKAISQEASMILVLNDHGRIISYKYHKSESGKLFRVYTDVNDGPPSAWFAGDQIGGIFYPVFTYRYGFAYDSDKITSAHKTSIPKKILIMDTKTYQFLGKEYNLQNDVIMPK